MKQQDGFQTQHSRLISVNLPLKTMEEETLTQLLEEQFMEII